jgi:hypothetical protein
MRYIFCSLLIFLAMTAFSQSKVKDDTLNLPDGYKQWTEYRTAFRFGLGVQKSFSTELGISRHKYMYNDLGFASKAFYASVEWTPAFSKKDQPVYAFKTGYEMNARVLAPGLEVKYQTDFRHEDIVLTPKIGIGVMGILNLFYGVNISTMNSPFPNIGSNQFSIVCNLNRKVLKRKKTI